jgi:cell division protein FtsQ
VLAHPGNQPDPRAGEVAVLTGTLSFRRRNRARSERRRMSLPQIQFAPLARALSVLVLALALALLLALALNRPLKRVTVDGAFQRVPALEVERAVREHLNGGFVTVDLGALRRAVEAIPWVDRARVQRRWPGGLFVQVTEQVAAARWGASALINARGEVFAVDARHVPAELPHLDGPPGSETQVAELYFQLYPRLLEAGLRAAALRLSERGAWELELANGVVIRFGRRQLNERVERFLTAGAPLIATRGGDIAALDMRYSNGFAVVWRTPATAPAARPASGANPSAQDKDNDA